MIMKKCLQTYYVIASALQMFLRHQKSSAVNRKIVTFYIILSPFWLKSCEEGYETQKIAICLRFCRYNCFMSRKIKLYLSASIHDHAEAFTNLQHHCQCSRNFNRFRFTRILFTNLKIGNFKLMMSITQNVVKLVSIFISIRVRKYLKMLT